MNPYIAVGLNPVKLRKWIIESKYISVAHKQYNIIGAMFGNRDHSTMIYSGEAIQNLIDTDYKFSQKVRRIERTI